MPLLTCPTCRQQFEPGPNARPPFCSARCRQIDLGRWLDEEYSFPTERLREDDDFEEPGDGEPQ